MPSHPVSLSTTTTKRRKSTTGRRKSVVGRRKAAGLKVQGRSRLHKRVVAKGRKRTPPKRRRKTSLTAPSPTLLGQPPRLRF